MAFAKELAGRIHAFGNQTPSADCLHWARMAVADTVGVALAGAITETARIVHRVAGSGGNGAARLIGMTGRASAVDAALINGTAAHALDFDDMTENMMGHPSVAVLPAALALGETYGVDGETLLRAYLIGFETAAKLGRAVTYDHHQQGWHSTGTLGTFGATAASAYLCKLDPGRTATALALACSLSSGLRANFGTMTKPFHAGAAARNGVFAALMAKQGFSANGEAFEHPQGFFKVFNEGKTVRPELALQGWFEPPEILDPGVCLKLYPCGAHTHPFIEMVRALRDEHGFTLDDVERIEALSETSRHNHTNRPQPKGGLDGKFSVQYTMARTLTDGAPRLEHFTDAAVKEPRVVEIMARIHAAAHPDLDSSWADKYGGEVAVHLKNGKSHRARIEHQIARGPKTPLTEGDLRGKFIDCAGKCLSEPRAESLFDDLMAIERCGNIATVLAKTAPDAP
ncbi:MAG: MmgE/PrpD family protein [Rhodospirillales bacterium]